MSEKISPSDEAELAEAVADAARTHTRLKIAGNGTKSGFGHQVEAEATLETVGLTGITLYEPASLTMVVRAGTPLSEVESALAKEGQHLPFEPPTLKTLYGTRGHSTIGGTIACGLSGPRRIQAGAARDSLIGVRFVTGTGEAVKNGGRVMKNVTGYDLVKLMCGSHGTLGVLTELSFKLLPKPEKTAVLLLHGLGDIEAVAALSAALTSPFDVTGAAHAPRGTDGKPVTMIRLEGFEKSVDYRAARLREMLSEFAETEVDASAKTAALWKWVLEIEPFSDGDDAVWRISVKPSDAPGIVARIRERVEAEVLYDWGGGLVWLRTAPEGDCGAAPIRSELSRTGGHATLMRAPDSAKEEVSVFQPQGAAIEAISAGLRSKFDPAGILNPGVMRRRLPEQAA